MNIYEVTVTILGTNDKSETRKEEVVARDFREVLEIMMRVEQDAGYVTTEINIRPLPAARPFDGRLR